MSAPAPRSGPPSRRTLLELTRRQRVTRLEPGDATPLCAEDAVALEAPLELRVEGRTLAVLLRTPGHDEELAVGWLRAEGVLERPDDLLGLEREGGRVAVTLAPDARARARHARRLVLTTSACGACSQTTVADVVGRFGRLRSEDAAGGIATERLFRLPAALRRAQTGFRSTGGLHGAALFNTHGDAPLCVREDVGRHNALDKVLGRVWLDGLARERPHVVVVSGRLGYELVAKTLALGAPVLAGLGAPSSLAIDLAHRAGITLVGFLRPDRLNVYTHPERLR